VLAGVRRRRHRPLPAPGRRSDQLDAQLTSKREIPLVGLPNRARVSASGRMLAWTVFVTGDSYNGGLFSTRAGILDTATGDLAGTLEDYAVTLDGKPYQAADLNFWGVTFTRDDRHFYATMSTAGHRYLVAGDFAAHTVAALRENVECPSVSPDGTRVAFKSAVDGDPAKGWRLSVLDLAASKVTALAETRSVDDQPAWLDDHTIGYGVPRGPGHADIWSVPADGSGPPRLLVPEAESPAALGS
jgi:WD40-like Beta Propeller Repeat